MTEWISIKDRLPTNNQEVLVWYKYDPSDGSWDYRQGYKVINFSFGKRVYESFEDKPGYSLSHWDYNTPNWHLDDTYTVTHWAELPAPPEKDS